MMTIDQAASVMYRQFVVESQLSPIDAKHGEIQELNPLRQWTHQQATANSDKNLNAQYANSRINDILLPATVASRVAFISKCNTLRAIKTIIYHSKQQSPLTS